MLLICTNDYAEMETHAIRTLIAKQDVGIILTVGDAHSSEGLVLIRSRKLPKSLPYSIASEG